MNGLTLMLINVIQLVGGDGNTRKLTPEEQAEYDDFEKHQKPGISLGFISIQY